MQNRRDEPLVDTSESYVWFNSPAILTTFQNLTYHADVAYGWSADEPMVLEMSISINMDSLPLDDTRYPEGHICDKCLIQMPNGTIAVSVLVGTLADGSQLTALWCIACARSTDAPMQTETWDLSLQHVRDALLDSPDYHPGSGDVSIQLSVGGTILVKLTGQNNDYAFLSLPLNRITAFIDAIDLYMAEDDMEAIENAYMDSSLEALERLANGQL